MIKYKVMRMMIGVHYVWTASHTWEELNNCGGAAPRLYDLEEIDGLSDHSYYILHECRANKRITVRRSGGVCTT